MEDKLQRLQLLLLRVRTVIEEADARCITNSGMLMQLKQLSESMYRGYYVLENFKYRPVIESDEQKKNLNNQGAPAILAIIGGHKVGKRTLVSHVCNTDKIRSHFSSMLHISGHVISSIEHDKFPCVRTLVVIEFTSDVSDDDWMKFYSCASRMGEGSKVVVISRFEKIARFATVKPIYLKSLSQEEFSYLFKVLAFGSTNPEDNPQLSSIGNELATLMQRSFIMGNILADVMRKNLNTQFWFHVLKRVSFGDLIVGSASPPKKMFELMTWESRLPPHSKIVRICVEDKTQDAAQSNKKQRRGVAI
ncbi:unnamed protein product [Miscanthus lutarioriparius]|uniref:Rx N-terminal domain-containing protein n=1 Tax=Miscanthus lutarioriparius TaxID=422564 RepID=A0A811NDW1_9POAL|nr:unnamed protein product [Miscanthus lutarioriparius]